MPTIKRECESCGGTGLYVGFAEPKGYAAECGTTVLTLTRPFLVVDIVAASSSLSLSRERSQRMIERQFAKIREQQMRIVWLHWLESIRCSNPFFFDYKE